MRNIGATVSGLASHPFHDSAFKPVIRLPNGDVVFCDSDPLTRAEAGEPEYQASVHIAGLTVAGPCYVAGTLDSSKGDGVFSTDAKLFQSWVDFVETNRRPRPINDHLLGTTQSYTEKGVTQVLPESASNFSIEERYFPYQTKIEPGRRSIEIFVKGKGYDPNATIGFDEGMNTHFLQSGLFADGDDDDDRPLIWLGTRPNEFRSVNHLLFALKLNGGYLVHEDWRP